MDTELSTYTASEEAQIAALTDGEQGFTSSIARRDAREFLKRSVLMSREIKRLRQNRIKTPKVTA
jgi:hypothetical protein